MSTHNIGFYEEISKIIFELSSNTHLNSSAGFKFIASQFTRSKRPQFFLESRHEKTCLWSLRPGPTQTGLYDH